MAKKQSRKKATRGAAKSARPRRGRSAAKRASAGRAAKKKAARKTTRTSAAARAKTAARGRRGARGRSAGRRAAAPRAGGGQLSTSALNATWVESLEDRAEHAGQTLATRSHEVIRRWAEERAAGPSTIPGADPDSPRVLQFNFPGSGGENLQPVSWDDWFRTFDDRNLVFVFQDRLKNGSQSNFFRFDSPNREDA